MDKDQKVPIELVEYSKNQFERFVAVYDALDGKSLGIMGIIGLLVGFQAISFDNIIKIIKVIINNKEHNTLCIAIIITFLIYAVFLIFGALFSLLSYTIRKIEYPTSAKKIRDEYLKIKEPEKGFEILKVDILNTYIKAAQNIENNNHVKSKILKCSIFCTLISLISLIFALILIVVYKSFF